MFNQASTVVPFMDLRIQHEALGADISTAIREVIDSSAFSGGFFVSRFEEEFAAYCGSKHAVGVGSGTEALWLTLIALGIGPGDEVITVPNTFIATAEAITFCGATPVFVDVEAQTYTMDPTLLEGSITHRTKAIIPVHLFGQMAAMDAILDIAGRHGIPVVEDACQAHGAEYGGRKAGTMGTAGCFSFYPGKNLGAMGEAGAVVTNDPRLKERIEVLRDHGQVKKYHHIVVGWNARMDGIQAAVLRAKLTHLDDANAARRRHADSYRSLLSGEAEIILPDEAPGRKHVYHLFALRTPRRDEILACLAQAGIHCGIHYPVPVHLLEAYGNLGMDRGSFPVAELCAGELLSLPMFPELTEAQVERAADGLSQALRATRLSIHPSTARSNSAPPARTRNGKGNGVQAMVNGTLSVPVPGPMGAGAKAAVRRTEYRGLTHRPPR